MKHYKNIIIGGGAGGLYLGLSLKNTLILERNAKVGHKLLISGGGNCNFTNKNVSSKNYFSRDKDFVLYALNNFKGIYDFLKTHKFKWQEKTHGRVFLSNKAAELVNVLVKNQKAEIKTDFEVKEIVKKDNLYIIDNKYSCENLVIATGGMSYGGTDFGIKIAKQFGHKIINTYPALVRFDLDDENLLGLAGLSVQGVKAGGFCDGVVFTKRGIGGPLVYQLSLYYKSGDALVLDFSGCEHIPQRIRKLLDKDKKLKIFPKKTAGYKFAEVMAGGVDVLEINPQTFESKKQKGLYFIGEILDVTGNLGGYNIHFAFASAEVVKKALIS